MSEFNYAGSDEEDEDGLMAKVYETNQDRKMHYNQTLDEEDNTSKTKGY